MGSHVLHLPPWDGVQRSSSGPGHHALLPGRILVLLTHKVEPGLVRELGVGAALGEDVVEPLGEEAPVERDLPVVFVRDHLQLGRQQEGGAKIPGGFRRCPPGRR